MDDCDELISEWLNFGKGVVDLENFPSNIPGATQKQNFFLPLTKKNLANEGFELMSQGNDSVCMAKECGTFSRAWFSGATDELEAEHTAEGVVNPMITNVYRSAGSRRGFGGPENSQMDIEKYQIHRNTL